MRLNQPHTISLIPKTILLKRPATRFEIDNISRRILCQDLSQTRWLARGLREQARLDYLLGASVKQGFGDRVALLLAHGASSNGRDFYNSRTHLENALLLGHNLIAKMLVDCGAAPPSLSPGEVLRVACLRGREEPVRQLASATLEARDVEATLVLAAQQGNLRAVRLCLDVLGTAVDATNDRD